MTAAATLDREAIATVDKDRQLDDILSLPDHLRDALWRVESANLEPRDATGGLIVAGMGGSAIGGALARAALGDRALRPIVVTRGYGLPPWTAPQTTVLCSSYSGNTEETLGAYEAAGAVGAHRPEGIWVVLGRVATAYYFLHFLVLLSILGRIERPLPLPESISRPVIPRGGGPLPTGAAAKPMEKA